MKSFYSVVLFLSVLGTSTAFPNPNARDHPDEAGQNPCNGICEAYHHCSSAASCNILYGKACAAECSCGGFCSRRLALDTEFDFDLTSEKSLELIGNFTDKGAHEDATFWVQHELISAESCNALRQYAQSHYEALVSRWREVPVGASRYMEDSEAESWASPVGFDHRWNKKLYTDDLVRLIGREETLKILDFFYDSLGNLTVDCMYISRHGPQDQEVMKGVMYSPWHIDDYSTMEISLNHEEYEGGEVLHITAEGAKNSGGRTGTATAHHTDIIHGITPVFGGAKYILILKHHYDEGRLVRISKEMVDSLTMEASN